jgi:YfiH family protein
MPEKRWPRADATAVVTELQTSADPSLFAQPDWLEKFPWLLQATTGRGPDGLADLSFYGSTPAAILLDRWQTVRARTGFAAVAHARQVHGARIITHLQPLHGLAISDDADGHCTSLTGILLAVSVADCVPISLVDARSHTVMLLHAGWRGIAADILERGVQTLIKSTGGVRTDLHCHLGPAICGRCYEVGPEVHHALGATSAGRKAPIDLRALLALRAARLGVPAEHVTRSAYCTRCHNDLFFSHRAGDRGRQMGLLGIRTV